MKTLICFISHIINENLITQFNNILEVSLKNGYDIIYCSPNIELKNDVLNKYIVNLNLSDKDIFDKYNNNHIKNHKIYISVFNKFNNYDYYWFIENDVTINNDNLVNGWNNLFNYYNTNISDLLCSKITKWTNSEAYKLRYPISLLNKYINNIFDTIDYDKLWFGFLPICRISNKLLNIIKEYYKNNNGFFEYIIPSLAKYYKLTITQFSKNNFDIDLSTYNDNDDSRNINRGSISWNKTDVIDYQNKYPKNVIIHPIKLY